MGLDPWEKTICSGEPELLPPDELCFQLRHAQAMDFAPYGCRPSGREAVSYPQRRSSARQDPAPPPIPEGDDVDLLDWLHSGGLEALRRHAYQPKPELPVRGTPPWWRRVVDVLATDPVRAALLAEEEQNPGLARDCWLLAGDPEGALACQAPARPGTKAGLQSGVRLALTMTLGAPLHAADLLSVVDPKITSVARQHPDELLRAMDVTLRAEEAAGRDFAREILGLPGLEWHGWLILNTTPLGRYVISAPMPGLVDNPALKSLLDPIYRQAENALREDVGLPRVGEGWVSETELFIAVRDALLDETAVEQHGRPDGFGRQHLDVWIPEWRVGIEFQGLQHDQPVDYFGGEEAFAENRRRDRLKKAKCARQGIHLIEVRPGYDLNTVLRDVRGVGRGGNLAAPS